MIFNYFVLNYEIILKRPMMLQAAIQRIRPVYSFLIFS